MGGIAVDLISAPIEPGTYDIHFAAVMGGITMFLPACATRQPEGFRIQRKIKGGSNKQVVYTWPSKKALASIMAKVKTISKQGTHQPLADLLHQLNLALRGWTAYFRHGVSKATFHYLNHHTWRRVVGWIRRKHRRATWRFLRRRYFSNGWRIAHDGVSLFDTRAVTVTRYRYRGTKIPTPWDEWNTITAT